MASVNRWAIYCHYYGVAVNPRFSLSDHETQRRRFSVNIELNPVTILNPNGTGNGLFWALATKKDPRKDPRNPLGITEEAGDTLSGHGSVHFYTGVPPVSSCALRESLPAASECGRPSGGDDAFGVATGIFPSLQGLRPLRRYAAIP